MSSMSLTGPVLWLTAVNVVSFLLYLISLRLSRRIDAVLIVLSVLGGSPGVVAAMLLFDRKPDKQSMTLRVTAVCALIIQAVVLLILKGRLKSELSFAFWSYLARHRVLLIWLLAVSLVTLIAYGADKLAAVRGRRRIPVAVLLGLAFIGGSVGALLGMLLFRHKIRQISFTLGVPLILLTQLLVLFFVMNIAF